MPETKQLNGMDPSKATRLTFRLNDDTVAMFKTIAAIKRMKLEDLGKVAEDCIKKYKDVLKELSSKL